MRQAESVFREECELVGYELGGGGAEALRVAAEAEEVNGGVDAGAGAVGVGVNVEGVVGNPVDEAAVAAVGGAAVVEEGALLVGCGGDAVGDAAPVGARRKEMAAACEGEGIGELQAVFVRVGDASNAGGCAVAEAVGRNGDLGSEAAGADRGLLRERRVRGFELEVMRELAAKLVGRERREAIEPAAGECIDVQYAAGHAGAAARHHGRGRAGARTCGRVEAVADVAEGELLFHRGHEIEAREAEQAGSVARLRAGEAVEKVESAVGGGGRDSAVGEKRKLLGGERVEAGRCGCRNNLAGTDLAFEREEQRRMLQPEIGSLGEWKARRSSCLNEAVRRFDPTRGDDAVVVAGEDGERVGCGEGALASECEGRAVNSCGLSARGDRDEAAGAAILRGEGTRLESKGPGGGFAERGRGARTSGRAAWTRVEILGGRKTVEESGVCGRREAADARPGKAKLGGFACGLGCRGLVTARFVGGG